MSALRFSAVLGLLVSLAACDSASGSGASGETTGLWIGNARYEIDSVLVDQNFHLTTDYETRYEFDLETDEDGLVYGFLNQYNTGTLVLREPRDQSGAPGIRVLDIAWDDELVQSWPVYGTYVWPSLELDLPEAESAGVFPEDLWTFTIVGGRARLTDTRIAHGYTFSVYEDQESPYTILLSPTNSDEFSLERQ